MTVSDGDGDAEWSKEKKARMTLLKNLIKELPSYQADRFDAISIFPGLESWLAYYKDALEERQTVPQNVLYEEWFKLHVVREDAPECNILFSKLFQNMQIRSSSEVRIKVFFTF